MYKVESTRIFITRLSCCLTKRTMGRGRGKGKKQTLIASREDNGSGEEEKIPIKRRGRPQKTLKDEIEEEEAEKIEEEEEKEGGNTKSSGSNKAMKSEGAVENGRKRKRSSEVNKNPESVKEENGVGTKTTNGSIKSVGFRQNGSRRKNKPRRAAELLAAFSFKFFRELEGEGRGKRTNNPSGKTRNQTNPPKPPKCKVGSQG
ncbi:hypothetical protein RJ640_010661 [Escallonia rubra]|uniref:Uncharacterized protein n=1 Tax=Escallonia rubra TaxID=112253 RepID=A0AA88UBM7_9ASTE|nr:hypothetical protein RJ640_010661 [Escallonia rubra]